jgi:serine/threonine protein kinase
MVDISEIVLKERIGRGSVGDVYRGYWRGTEVAIKKMPTVNITQNFMKDMLREAEIMK